MIFSMTPLRLQTTIESRDGLCRVSRISIPPQIPELPKYPTFEKYREPWPNSCRTTSTPTLLSFLHRNSFLNGSRKKLRASQVKAAIVPVEDWGGRLGEAYSYGLCSCGGAKSEWAMENRGREAGCILHRYFH